MTSLGFSSFFQNFDVLGCYWDKRAKNGAKWQKNMSITFHISRTIHHKGKKWSKMRKKKLSVAVHM